MSMHFLQFDARALDGTDGVYVYVQINSQPSVDGAKSEDPALGWGPINGYVYQKVSRCEICNPSKTN